MYGEKIVNLIKMHSALAQTSTESTSIGKITGYDPVNFLVTVEIQPADEDEPALQTGWIPIVSIAVGPEWGIQVGPQIGNICEVHYQEGSLQNAYAASSFFGLTALPMPVQSGEFFIVHSTGSFLKFTNDGKVSINGNVEIDITSPVINITCTTSSTITAPEVNVISPNVKIGPIGSSFQPVLLADFTPSTTLQAF